MPTPEPTPEQDQNFMLRALELARATAGLASPNPQVGCVLVRGNYIIGEGAHLYDQRDHAEIAAIKDASYRNLSPLGSTAYVTLEPCSHQGRTGPCADTLIAAGIRRAVVATIDPNPAVSGRGVEKLRAAGIEVTIGVCEQIARDLIENFAHFIHFKTPFVTLKAALSVDGKLAPPPAKRSLQEPYWLTGPAAREQVQQLRHASDAILTGIGTVLADNPSLTDRTGKPRRRPLLRVVLDTYLRIPINSQLIHSIADDLLILCGQDALPRSIAALQSAGAEVLPFPTENGKISLTATLDELGKRNILSLLLESGSHLNGAFLSHNLVDKAILIYAETELGEDAIPFAPGISPFLFEQTLTLIERTTYGPDACITGYIRK